MKGKEEFRSILAPFSIRLLHRGYIVLFGVVLGVIGGLNEFFDGAIKLAPWVSFAIVGVSLSLSALWAAYDLISERDRAISRLQKGAAGPVDPRYEPLSDLIGRSTASGAELSEAHALHALDGWEEQTKRLIAAAYGEGEVAHIFTRELKGGKVFMGRDMFRAQWERPPPKAEVINNVNALLGRMPGLVIRADFDPGDWEAFDTIAFRETHARQIREGDDPRWTCPWCSRDHAYWKGHCEGCGAERVGDFLYPGISKRQGQTGIPPSPLEEWLESRIAAAKLLESQRGVRSNEWFFEAMGDWDVENIKQMHDGPTPIAPDLVDRYRENPETGQTDGLRVSPNGRSITDGEKNRYYGQRLAWMHATVNQLIYDDSP